MIKNVQCHTKLMVGIINSIQNFTQCQKVYITFFLCNLITINAIIKKTIKGTYTQQRADFYRQIDKLFQSSTRLFLFCCSELNVLECDLGSDLHSELESRQTDQRSTVLWFDTETEEAKSLMLVLSFTLISFFSSTNTKIVSSILKAICSNIRLQIIYL